MCWRVKDADGQDTCMEVGVGGGGVIKLGKATSEVKMIDDLAGSSMPWMVSVVQKGKFDLESKPHILQKFWSNDL